ncbi:MAG: molybdenum cofactor biosynthesis protein MoaE [Myxococcota bacterium]
MRVRVLLFAGLREAVGGKELLFDVPDGTRLGELMVRVEAEQPAVARYQGRLMVSRNTVRGDPQALLEDGDEIALLPPMSGGAAAVRVRAEPLSLNALLHEVQAAECGGVVTFTGVVRSRSRGQDIDHLEYEAYEPMAERELESIVEQVRGRWPEVRIALAHRVGRLAIGDAAVMIAVAAPHRVEAFEACRFAIDTLKRSVPIWKKEFSEDGACWIEENP